MLYKQEVLQKLGITTLPEMIIFAANMYENEDLTVESADWIVTIERNETHLFSNVFNLRCFDCNGESNNEIYEEVPYSPQSDSVAPVVILAGKLLKNCSIKQF